MARCMLCRSAVDPEADACPHCGGALDREADASPVPPSEAPVAVGEPDAAAEPSVEPSAWDPAGMQPPVEPAGVAGPGWAPSAGPGWGPGGPAWGPVPAPGYGAPVGYGPPPASVSQVGYGPQPSWGPPGYGPQASWGPPGYGPQPAWGPPGYGPGWGPAPWVAPIPAVPRRPTDNVAIASAVVSAAALFIAFATLGFGFVMSPVGAVLGHVALRRIGRTGDDGRGWALVGIIAGWLGTAVLVLAVALIVALVAAG